MSPATSPQIMQHVDIAQWLEIEITCGLLKFHFKLINDPHYHLFIKNMDFKIKAKQPFLLRLIRVLLVKSVTYVSSNVRSNCFQVKMNSGKQTYLQFSQFSRSTKYMKAWYQRQTIFFNSGLFFFF